MRNILFRGRNKSGETFVGSFIYCKNEIDKFDEVDAYVDEKEENLPYVAIFPNNEESDCVKYTYLSSEIGTFDGMAEIVEKESIGQWSGLKDKNGTMIFEGDKVRGLFLYGDSVVGVCDFQRAAFGLKWMRGDIEEFTPFCCTHGVEWEVVDDE